MEQCTQLTLASRVTLGMLYGAVTIGHNFPDATPCHNKVIWHLGHCVRIIFL